MVAHVVRERLELLPGECEVAHLVLLLLGHAHLVPVEHRVHLLDGAKELLDLPLLLAHDGEVAHGRTHVVEVRDLALEVASHVLDPRNHHVELALRLLVQVLRVLRFPARRLALERVLERRRLERQGADVVHGRDLLDLRLDGHVLFELRVEVFDGGLLLHEQVVSGRLVVLPQPRELHEDLEVLVDLPLGALEGAREQQHHLDNLREALRHRLGRRPHDELLRSSQDGARAPVDCGLDVVERRSHRDAWNRELHVDVEEGAFEEEEAAARARADALLDRRERGARAVEHRAVHEAAVVLAQLGLLLLGSVPKAWLELVLVDELEQVGDALLDLEVLGGHERRLLLDPLLLHTDEAVERNRLVVGDVDE